MRGIAIIVAEAAPARFRAALTMALATRALGGRARLFLEAEAVSLVASTADEPDRREAGLPTTAELIEEALGAGVRVTLCQSGLARAGLTAGALDARFDYGGMIGLLADVGEDRLIVA